MKGITGASSSPGLYAPHDPPRAVQLPKNLSTASLPNLISPPQLFHECLLDDDGDQPFDFSKKYCETKIVEKIVDNDSYTYQIYAETDLDQPTDYSLRYAEADSDSEECKMPKAEFVQDTVKTYCTEDTPYETPFNFSTSTSMSDLREDKEGKVGVDPKRSEPVPIKALKSQFSSGVMSPEKPVNYCDEGTPGYFSRVDSCGSLNLIPAPEAPKEEPLKEKKRGEVKAVKFEEVVIYAEETPLMFSRSSSLASLDSIEQHSIHDDRSSVVSDFSRLTSGLISPSELPDSPSQTIPPSPKPCKTPLAFSTDPQPPDPPPPATEPSIFEDVVKNFKTETTPLHFSTATSLSSLLDDQDQKPEETTRESPIKAIELSESSEDEDILAACINIGMKNNRYSQGKGDMASDSLRTYCTEDTPAVLSHAGSRSDISAKGNEVPKEVTPPKNEASDDEDDDILSDCINIGMKNNKYSKPRSDFKFPGDSVMRYHTEDTPVVACSDGGEELSDIISGESDDEDEMLLEECVRRGMATMSQRSAAPPSAAQGQGSSDNSPSRASSSSSLSDDALLQQCILAGMPKRPPKPADDLTDAEKILLQQIIVEGMKKCRISPRRPPEESNELTEDEQALLRQCILSGMPKTKPTRTSTELTESERVLLQQCILAGMPKGKPKKKPLKEEHKCCVHCPKRGEGRTRRRYKGEKTKEEWV